MNDNAIETYHVVLHGPGTRGSMPDRLRPYAVTPLGEHWGLGAYRTAVQHCGDDAVLLVRVERERTAVPIMWHGPIAFGTVTDITDFLDLVLRASIQATEAHKCERELEDEPFTTIERPHAA